MHLTFFVAFSLAILSALATPTPIEILDVDIPGLLELSVGLGPSASSAIPTGMIATFVRRLSCWIDGDVYLVL